MSDKHKKNLPEDKQKKDSKGGFNLPNAQNAQAVLAYSSLGIQIAVIVGGFAYLGKWLDEKYPMDKRWFTLIMVLLGVAVSMYHAVKQLNQINNKKNP